jgi:hypothetical protein
MTLSRLSLVLNAAALGGVGAALLVRPRLIDVVGMKLDRPEARTEVRAMYGGFELGLAGFFALAATRPEWECSALSAQALSLGALVAARLAGMKVDRSGGVLKLFAALEGSAAALAAVALARSCRRLNGDGRN